MPSATRRLKEPHEGAPRTLGRQKVPRDLRLRKYLLICGPRKFAAQARSAWGPRDGTKALHGPRTQAYGETNCSDGESPRLKYCKMLRPIKVLGCWRSTPLFGSLRGLFILASDIFSDDYFLHHIEQLISISISFGVSILFLRSALLCQTIPLKLWGCLFLSKYFLALYIIDLNAI